MKLRTFLQPTLHSSADADPTGEAGRIAGLIYPVQLALLGLLLVAIVTATFFDVRQSLPVLLMGLATVLISLIVSRRGYMQLAGATLVIAMLAIVSLLLVFGQGIHDIAIISYPIMLVVSSLLLSRRSYILICALTLLTVISIILAEMTGILVTDTSSVTSISDLIILPAILFVVAWVMRLLADHNDRTLEQARQLNRLQSDLISEVRRRADHLSILNRVGAAVTSGLDLEHVLSALYDRVQEVAPNDTFSVALYDKVKREVSFPIFIDLGRSIHVPSEEVRQEPGLTGEVIERGRTIYLPDLRDPEAFAGLPVVTLGDSTTRSYVGVPLFLQDEVIGVLSVQSQDAYAYQPDQIRLLETIGNHAAIALQNARLYAALQDELEERRRMQRALHQRDSVLEAVTLAAGKFLLEPDWRISLSAVMARLGQETGSTHACIYRLIFKDKSALSAELLDEWSASGTGPGPDNRSYQTLAVTMPGWAGWLETLRHGEASTGAISSLIPEQVSLIAVHGVKSFLNVPIIIEGELWGFIGFYDLHVERTWTQAEIDAIQIAAGLLAAAILRQRDDERIHDLNTELEQRVRERTADLESFAYSVAHDLRAPLRGLDGYSKLLQDEYGDRLDGEAHTYLNNIRQAAQWMGQLIEDLLKLSRVTRIEMHHTRVDLSQFAADTLSTLRAHSPNRSVEWSVEPGMVVVGDPNLLRLALDNLLLNSWKFTGKIDAAAITVGFSDQDAHRVYFVRDNGVGFDMRFANKLFNPFQRLHQPGEFEGTGIGLATVKRIIQRHNGDIWAESTPSQGATFYFTLPA